MILRLERCQPSEHLRLSEKTREHLHISLSFSPALRFEVRGSIQAMFEVNNYHIHL